MQVKNTYRMPIWTSNYPIKPGEVVTVSDEEGSQLLSLRAGDIILVQDKSDIEQPSSICPHCGKEITSRNKRFHFDACRKKEKK